MKRDLLNSWAGRQIGEHYTLGQYLGPSGDAAVYEAEFEGVPVLIKVRENAPGLVDQWLAVQKLEHPDLTRILAAGSGEIDEVPAAYVVVERPDETLAGVLAERKLTGEEAREMLAPTVSTLHFLHERNFVHGAIQPENFVAVGDQMKLASDTVRPARGEQDKADDVRAVGAMLVQAFTGDAPGGRSDPAAMGNAPDDLAMVARQTLDADPAKRWTIAQLANFLKTGALPEVKHESPAAPPSLNFISNPPKPKPDWLPEELPPAKSRTWIYGAVGVFALALLAIFAVGRKKAEPAAARPVAQQTAAASADAPRTSSAATPADLASRATRPREVAPANHNYKAGWAVVVASYVDRGAAEHRMQAMAKRWRGFKPEVIQEPGSRSLHLVVLGHGLSEEKAAAIRRRAVSSGMPRDTYIRKFS